MSNCVIVMGCYRSGTSAVAGILHHLGVNMGLDFQEPNDANPKGYFEDSEIVEINQDLYESFEGHNPKDSYPAAAVIQKARMTTFLTTKDNSCDWKWGFKDPKWCLNAKWFLPPQGWPTVWNGIPANADLIVVNRCVDDVVKSLVLSLGYNIKETSLDQWYGLVNYYNKERDLYLKRHLGRMKYINFSQILDHPEKTIFSIANWLGEITAPVDVADTNRLDTALKFITS